MIIVKIQGGLGNQMFQYAFYKLLSENNICFVDISEFKKKKKKSNIIRKLELHNAFGIDLSKNIYEVKEVNLLIKRKLIDLFNRLSIKLFKIKLIEYGKLKIEYPHYKIDYYLNLKDGYFDGYWQSEKYFQKVSNQITQEFRFKIKDNLVLKIRDKILLDKNSTSLHWRKGDYSQFLNLDILSLNYFRKALNFMITNKKISNVYIFSEDYEWVEKELTSLNLGLKFINISKIISQKEDYYEMYLMSKCKNNIISNSSFSWWAAYLNENENKTIISPNRWYREDYMNLYFDQMIPDNWIKMEIEE